ncbi:geranylgeranylglyceryl/heptaprenylglyceryl phosphate synthase [Planococcus salinarum]|uniref:Heptaprenylglyceryl phosphate synthase n=1 Tax=Planococcus salinarum TaxID=622695 RepID=A0ABX3D1T7_9BACL|nr:heptaprenylglyceryl phosphate synthase [Planococcus salinarum]OHX51121.1 geranylgeranylglyceryl/heptaprenylglyceryl phosphate synthase [Planococcus salinarum]TAA71788.1 heptaprenylglyceryl phosphate synthase [Planococcus salinarum]
MEYQSWRHVFKLDPAKEITDGHLERICKSGTDAILIGGSDDVTLENVLDLMARVDRFTVPVVLEISTVESVAPGFDLYFIPTVLNSRDPKWIKGLHHEAIREYGDLMDWEELIPEGYCILNPDCKAARLTDADTLLNDDDVVAYARLAEHFFKLPIFYMEYSGIYGNPELVKEVKGHLSGTRLFYGGGIDSAEKAREMAKFADTVVVGNVIYSDIEQAIRTVEAVAETVDQSL